MSIPHVNCTETETHENNQGVFQKQDNSLMLYIDKTLNSTTSLKMIMLVDTTFQIEVDDFVYTYDDFIYLLNSMITRPCQFNKIHLP